MKQYKQYLEDKYEPITQNALVMLQQVVESGADIPSKSVAMMRDEILYLRSLLAEAYPWIGIRPPSRLPRDYMRVLKEAQRIRAEVRAGGL